MTLTIVAFATSTSCDALSDANLITEAVLRDDAIIASNTSYLDINILAQHSTNPSRVIGLHFFRLHTL